MSSRRRSSRSSGPRSPGTPSSTPTSTTSTPGWKSGATATRPCVTRGASTRATRTATASARCTSTRWRASGPCCAPGCGPTAASRRRSCRSTSPSSSSCTTPGAGVRPSSVNSSPPWWREVPTTPDPDKSAGGYGLTGTANTLGTDGPFTGTLGALTREYEALGGKDTPSDLEGYYEAAFAQENAALCLSGGGIRSAAFALGVVQALARMELLTRFQYLSTVSGGGYLGAWLSRWILDQRRQGRTLEQ